MRNMSHTYGLLSIWLLFTLMYIDADQEEDDFIAVYGNDNGTSGVWPEVRAIASDEQKLKELCRQTHQQMGLGAEDVISRVNLTTKTLTFHNYNESMVRHPIDLDVVKYGIVRMPASAWYITKGTKSYCVFYLILFDALEKRFRLGLETCGIHMPTPAS